MHDGFRLGIDYGTSNTVAVLAWPDGHVRPLLFDGSPVLPSAICAGDDGTLIAGREAARTARLAPERFEPHPKRRIDDLDVLLGDRSYPLGELFAATLRRVAAEATRTAGTPVTDVTVTHPVEWGPARRALLAEAADRAGLPHPALVPEPVAAATYFVDVLGHRVPVGSSVVVYDLGGGTFDACVVRRTADGFEPLSYAGLDDVGGIDLDALVVEIVGQVAGDQAPAEWQRLLHPGGTADLRHSRTLWEDARLAKEALSRQTSAGVFVPLVERDVHVTREQFEERARAVLSRTAEVTVSAIRQARITPADVAGLFLVGGSTRVPLVATVLHQQVGLAPIALEQPEIVVAEGALHQRAAAPAPASRPGPYPPALPLAGGPATTSGGPIPAPGGPITGDPFPAAGWTGGLAQTSGVPGDSGPVSAVPGGAGPVSGVPGGNGPVPGTPDGAAPMSAPPGAASPVSSPVPVPGPGPGPVTVGYQAASPVPDVSAPPPDGGTAPAPGVPHRSRRRRLAVVLGLCAAAVAVLLVAAGVTWRELTTPRALPADLHAHACKYVDLTPLYTKFGVAKPSAAPVSHREFKVYTECTLDTSNRRKGIDITKVTFDVSPYASGADASKSYAFWVQGMRDNDRYPVKKLSMGDEAAVGPLPNLIAASSEGTGSGSGSDSGSSSDYDPGPGLQIVVRKDDYVLRIEVDLEVNDNVQYEGGPRPSVPRRRLDTEATALTQAARASLAKVSAVMK